MTTRAVSSHECNCLANCKPQNVSVHCCLVFVRSVQEAIVVPTASATAGAHRDHLFVVSFTQQP